jgi:hypothetical protein
MAEHRKADENIVIDEIMESTLYVRRRTITRTSAAPTERASLFPVIEEQPQEEPSEEADVKFKITDVVVPDPSENAALNFNLTEGEGSVQVPGRFTGQLLDAGVTLGCVSGIALTAKWVMEAGKESPQGWIALSVVTVVAIGILILRWRGRKR